jgi:hypothetical protein
MPFDGKIELFTKTNPVADVLRRAKALIDSPEKWLQCTYRNSAGDKFCVAGAIHAASLCELEMRAFNSDRARMFFRRAINKGFIENWNDRKGRTHAQVMKTLDKAIALAERE